MLQTAWETIGQFKVCIKGVHTVHTFYFVNINNCPMWHSLLLQKFYETVQKYAAIVPTDKSKLWRIEADKFKNVIYFVQVKTLGNMLTGDQNQQLEHWGLLTLLYTYTCSTEPLGGMGEGEGGRGAK